MTSPAEVMPVNHLLNFRTLFYKYTKLG